MSSLIPRPRRIERPPLPRCPLPFSLQNLCLLRLINDLDNYPVELLASMPLWLRNLLLNNLPALDLCQLENSPVSRSIDLNAIWDMRVKVEKVKSWKPNWYPRCGNETYTWHMMYKMIESDFQVDVGLLQSRPYGHYDPCEDIKSAVQGINESPQPKQLYLFEVMSEILSTSSLVDHKKVIHKMISIQGDLMLSNLLSDKSGSITEYDQRVWTQQAIPLAVKGCIALPHYRIRSGFSFEEYREYPGIIHLTPHRLLSMADGQDKLQLLSFLARDPNLQPSSASVPISLISQSILPKLKMEKFASVPLPSNKAPYSSFFSHLLRNVVVLRLQCDNYADVGILVRMIKAATADGDGSLLKHLFCVIPGIYIDVVQPFLSLYSLKNFHQLTIMIEPDHGVNTVNVDKLLQGFMTIPCLSTQKLIICSRRGICPPEPQFEFFRDLKCPTSEGHQLGKGVSVPNCATEHKLLRFFPAMKSTSTSALSLLLQAPVIRLKEIALVLFLQCYEHLHSLSTHPDVQVQKLIIDIDLASSVDAVIIQADIVSLLMMHSLRKICIYGTGSSTTKLNDGLVQGLRQRTQSGLPPLTKIVIRSAEKYQKQNFKILCDAIFSLPQLENLKVVLGGKLAKMQQFAVVLHHSWVSNSSKVQLKSLTLQMHETKCVPLSLVTQNLSFTSDNMDSEKYVYTIYI